MRRLAVIALLAGAAVGSFAGLAFANDVPLPRPRPSAPPAWSEPRSFREAAGPDFKTEDVTSAPSDCRERLETMAAVRPVPRLIGPGACGGGDMVELNAVLRPDRTRIEIWPGPVLRCQMAEAFAAWVREEAAPRALQAGAALQAVETYDDFNCRGRNRIAGAKLSEHGKGNAIDVRMLILANKTTLSPTDMTAPKDLREGLRESACSRFTTVLGPSSDGFHESHIHLDLAERHNGYRICQWAVLEPPKPAVVFVAVEGGEPVPLPVPRPPPPQDAKRWPRKL